MANRYSLFNLNVFIFVLVIVLSILIFSVYTSVKPEKTVPYNFSPFPNIAPTSLPDPNRPTDNCFNNLTPCDSNGQCSACSLDNYECKNVSQEQADAKLYHINGINVPKGNWCLPKDINPQPCNTYTGRYMWVYDPGYCNSITPGQTQCWKCECLYPSLFGDPSTGCTAKLACQNDSVKSNSIVQPENGLIGTSCAPTNIVGKTWDPTTEDPNMPTENSIYQFTPYDQDKNRNPWFSCDCGQIVADQYFAQLPGDPYNCHLEPCYKSLGYKSSGLQNCDSMKNCGAPESCSCSCDSPNVALSPNGKFGGTCVLISQSCGNYGYDTKNKKCTCPSPSWERSCKNINTGVNMQYPHLPDCILPENSLGSECYDPCQSAMCEHGSYCISCGPNSWNEVPMCNIEVSNPKEVHGICDCTTVNKTPPSPFVGYMGPNCSIACLGDGTTINTHYLFEGNSKYYTCNCCCSQNYRKTNDFWGIYYDEVCDGSYPPLKSPDPSCIPAKDCT